MRRITILGAGIVTVVALGFGATGAVAADQPSLADDVAARLGISVDKLRAAFEDALTARIDAAVASGKLTKEQGDKLKERIANAKGLVAGMRSGFAKPHKGFRGHFGFGGHLRRGFGFGFGHAVRHGSGAAAEYLGLSRDELRAELRKGKSLAQIATDHGKTADGLVAAMLKPFEERLQKAVDAKRLTQKRADAAVARLQEQLEKLVQHVPKAKPKTDSKTT